MLSEISWSQKDKFHLYKIPRVTTFIETEQGLPEPGGRETALWVQGFLLG